ncbi:MAG TPA: hypothetical protein ENH82_16480 [bacterium]|nr:hypothetical protein [bacterium]
MKKIVALITIVLISGCLFPVPQSLRGIVQTYDNYTLRGGVEFFDALNLKKHLPVDAPVFIEFGVDSCMVAEFNRGNETYAVELYSFLSPRGAMGTYFVTDIADSKPFKLGYEARRSDKAIQFVKGHYFVTVSPLKNGTMESAVELASGFEKRIEGGAIKPNLFQTLPRANMVENTKYYFTGPQAFAYRYSVALGKALNVAFATYGVAAKYTVDHTEVDLIKIRFPGRRESLDAVDTFLKTREDRPILYSLLAPTYNTVLEPDDTEIYIAESGNSLHIMLGASGDKKGQDFFEYILRGGK